MIGSLAKPGPVFINYLRRKGQPSRDRSAGGARYALIVSIRTPVEGVDIWTPVAQQIGVAAQDIQIEW